MKSLKKKIKEEVSRVSFQVCLEGSLKQKLAYRITKHNLKKNQVKAKKKRKSSSVTMKLK